MSNLLADQPPLTSSSLSSYLLTELGGNISDLIMEDPPYILPFDVKSYSIDHVLTLELSHNQSHYNENLDKLLQVISTIGSYSIALRMSSNSRNAYLGSHLRIRKHNFSHLSTGTVSATSTAIIDNERRGKCFIHLFAENAPLYSFELEYSIVNKNDFSALFHHCYHPQPDSQNLFVMIPPPSVVNEYLNDHHFKIYISKFGLEHCAGHFENYPIIPAVRVFECLMSGIRLRAQENSLNKSNLLIDSVEMFPNVAMPIHLTYCSHVVVQKNSKRSTTFSCNVTDEHGKEYGNYIIGIK